MEQGQARRSENAFQAQRDLGNPYSPAAIRQARSVKVDVAAGRSDATPRALALIAVAVGITQTRAARSAASAPCQLFVGKRTGALRRNRPSSPSGERLSPIHTGRE